MDELPWLTLSDAAERTGLSRETLRSRVRRGKLPSRVNNRGELLVQVSTGDGPVTAVTTGPDHGHDLVDDLREEVEHWRQAAHAHEVAKVRAEADLAALERYVARIEQPFWRRWFG